MKKLRVEELKAGMVFDKAVYIDKSNILVAPMVPLKEEDVNRLRKWGIEEVETAGELVEQRQVEKQKRISIQEELKKLTEMVERGGGAQRAPEEEPHVNVFDRMLRLIEDIFENVRNGVGYDKKLIVNAVDELIIAVSRDKNDAIHRATTEQEGKYLHTLGVSVASLSAVTGMSLGFGHDKLLPLVSGALLHDVGMVRVPLYITEKKGILTPDEYNRIKTHTIYGYRIVIKELELGNEVATMALQHHESYDGSGYPRKLSGEEISAFARIVSICDVFVAMTKKRSYRDEHLSYQAMKTILGKSSSKFDPEIVKAFLSNMAIYPVGSLVQLNSGAIAKVVSANSEFPLRPKVSVVLDESGDKVKKERMIDLQNVSSLYIRKAVSKTNIGQPHS
jgi:HD-GYP domain-containing protein (c-di-GMP phosphodiesterase class II)